MPPRLTPRVSGSASVIPAHGWYLPVKHAFDFIGALLLLIPALPLILAAALATRLTSPGPAFYWQTRLGRHGRPF
ncbi:MAG TPA: sugar transferase, partial [Planctomycetaceae bacterium]